MIVLYVLISVATGFITKPIKFGDGLRLQVATADATKVAKSPNEDGINKLFQDSLEEVAGKRLEFTKPIPAWIKGTLVRNGPSVFGTVEGAAVQRRYSHVFDGLARLTAYDFNEGKVIFSAKFIDSQFYKTIVKDKKDIPPSIATAPVVPDFNWWQKIIASFASFDNTPVNLHQFGGRGGPWCAITDAPVLMQFDPKTAGTVRRAAFTAPIVSSGGVELFSTSHPKNDVNPNIPYSYNYFLEYRPFPFPASKASNVAHMAKIDKELNRVVIGSVELGVNVVSYIHDISVTENYAILCVWPLYVDMAKMANGKGFLPQMEWQADKGIPTKIYVFDLKRTDGDTSPFAYFESVPLFAYHHINAFEQSSKEGKKEIVLDIVGYDAPDIVNSPQGFAYVDLVTNSEFRHTVVLEGQAYRFHLPIPSSPAPSTPLRVEPYVLKCIDDRGFELTREFVVGNPQRRGLPYKYSYGVATRAGDGPLKGKYLNWALVKQSIEKSEANRSAKKPSQSCTRWSADDCFPSEPIFVPKPNGKSEDDGVLLSQVLDGKRGESFLLVLDATTMKEISRAYLGISCPISFHGQFVESNN